MKIRCAMLSVFCFYFLAQNSALAACPTPLADQKIANTDFGQNLPIKGVTLSSSYRVGGDEYIVAGVNPTGSNAVQLYRFKGNDHNTLIGSSTASSLSYNKDVDISATMSFQTGVVYWGVAWGYVGTSNTRMGYRRHYRFGDNPWSSSASQILSSNLGDSDIRAAVTTVSGANYDLAFATLALTDYSGLNRPYLKFRSYSGTSTSSDICVGDECGGGSWIVDSISVTAFTDNEGDEIVAVAYSEYSPSTNYSLIKFQTYSSGGTPIGSLRTIMGTYNPSIRLTDVKISGVGDSLILVWDAHSTTSRLNSNSYFQAFPAFEDDPYFPAQRIDADGTWPTTSPDVSAAWTQIDGVGVPLFSVTFDRILSGCDSDGGICRYSMIKLYRTPSSPVDVIGTQWLSWYPHRAGTPSVDGPKTEIFTNCTDGVVIGGAHYSNSMITPTSARGLRRSFFSVSSSSLDYSGMSFGEQTLQTQSVKIVEDDSFYSDNAQEALLNDGYLFSDRLVP